MMKVLNQAEGQGWIFYHGDNTEILPALPDNSIDLSVSSWPFSSLYTYSPSERDVGNCRSDEEFAEHMGFVARQLFRLHKPGRCASIHVMDLPTSKERDGIIGLRDFRGLTIAIMQAAGFVFHSCTTIWKDPVTAMQRTHALGLLYKQLQKDSTRSRSGFPDYMLQFFKPLTTTPEEQRFEMLEWVLREMLPGYLLAFRKDAENEVPVSHSPIDYPVDRWQRVASPVWGTREGITDDGFVVYSNKAGGGGILPGDTLQGFRDAREQEDEKHICPLQLGAIRRIIELYSNPGETVLDYFGGIGSTPYCAVEMGRRGVAIELKGSYYEQGIKNVAKAEPGRLGKQLEMKL